MRKCLRSHRCLALSRIYCCWQFSTPRLFILFSYFFSSRFVVYFSPVELVCLLIFSLPLSGTLWRVQYLRNMAKNNALSMASARFAPLSYRCLLVFSQFFPRIFVAGNRASFLCFSRLHNFFVLFINRNEKKGSQKSLSSLSWKSCSCK